MLLFNNDTVDEDSLELIFQNILCYCLTDIENSAQFIYSYFKTSYVTV